ncbi:MAG: hypothetical protein GEU93_10295 [Propionibacteriales bacterium]|nr:hypothetical protein [Propionibacteriales bacterium]
MVAESEDVTLDGAPHAVEDLTTHLQRTALSVRNASDSFAAVGRAGALWDGDVAQGFLHHVHEVSRRLDTIEEELRDADVGLRAWRAGFEERLARLSHLQDQYRALPRPADELDDGTDARERLRAEMEQVRDDHEREAGHAANHLSQAARALASAGSIDVSTWVAEAEARVREMDEQISTWIDSQGGPLSDAVSSMGQATALSATVSEAAGAVTPGATAALTAAVVSVAATAPGSHRLVAAARKAQRPIPVEALPRATFAPGGRHRSTDSGGGGSIRW